MHKESHLNPPSRKNTFCMLRMPMFCSCDFHVWFRGYIAWRREMIKDRKQSLTVKAILQEAFFYACIFTVPKFSAKIKLTMHGYVQFHSKNKYSPVWLALCFFLPKTEKYIYWYIFKPNGLNLGSFTLSCWPSWVPSAAHHKLPSFTVLASKFLFLLAFGF